MNSQVRESYRTLDVVAYSLFAIGPLVGNAVLVLLGPIAVEFGVNPTAVLIAVPAFMFPFAIVQLFSGALSDLFGRIPVIASGLAIYAAGLLLTGWSSTLDVYIIGNLISGLGFGFVNPVLLALLTDTVIPDVIPKRMGIAGALGALSVGLGPFIAGLIAAISWRSFYFLFLLITIVGAVAVFLSKSPPRIKPEGPVIRLLLRNLAIELRRPVILLLLISAFMVSMSYIGTLIWTSRGLTGAIGEDMTGILLLGAGVSGAIAGLVLGATARKRGMGASIGIAMIALVAALVLLIIVGDITTPSSIWLVGIALFIDGWAGGTLFPVLITYSQILSPDRRGVLSGVVSFSNFIGISLVPIIYEPLFLQSITLVYYGILGVAILLAVFLFALNRASSLIGEE
ncbi:MAG: MFS transporter [Candidatus Thorarchaeota archaeon]|jgi:DHA1 family bicyclomycin/chloramphenicol resistance-like MFS transporter